MRDLFRGYYRPTDEEFAELWQKCMFVVDANVLLNLYRYPEKARDELLAALKRIEDRIWVPHQAALEYQRVRPTVIAEQKNRFQEVRAAVSGVLEGLESKFEQMQIRERHALIDPDGLVRSIKPIVEKFLGDLDELEKSQPDVHDDDPLRDEIHSLLRKRVGSQPTKEEIESICSEGEERYALKLPPGYMDAPKENDKSEIYSYGGVKYPRKFGDLIIWKQLLQYAKDSKPRSVIFLTDDGKEDWWWTINSRGKKVLGPRPELSEEIYREADVRQFYMYNSEQFLKHAQDYLSASVSKESIEQVREVAARVRGPSWEATTRERARTNRVIENILIDQYPTSVIDTPENGWPDLVLHMRSIDQSIGIEIVSARRFYSTRTRIQRLAYRAFESVHQGQFAGFEIIVVISDDEHEDKIANQFVHSEIELPPGVGITIGSVVRDKSALRGYTFVTLVSHQSRLEFS